MTKCIVIAVFALALGCGKKTPEDNILAEYTKMKENVCACTDKDCAMRAKAQADAIEQRAREDIKNPSKETQDKFEKVEKEINECAHKFE